MKNIIKQPEQHRQTPWAMPDDSKIYIGGIDPISEESTVHYQKFTLRELEEFLEALENNKTDDRGDI